MSLQRHREIYPYDEGTTRLDRAPAHRLDESPAGYSWRGALQHGPLPLHQPALCCNQNQCRSTRKQRMANHGLTSCLSPAIQFKWSLHAKASKRQSIERQLLHRIMLPITCPKLSAI